ncbi:hypothetical protein HYY70_04080 [Candidatus Woesearchaeota archaeon]|nr:hypothetical protein [Candidatus Woesearchaeota archaeon]
MRIFVNGSASGVRASVGQVQELRKREINDTTSDGTFEHIFNSTNHSIGVYSIVSVAKNSLYNTNFNHTVFEIIKDATPPSVNLVSPGDSFASALNNLTFVYNVSDIHSNISSCQLIVDGVIVQTNSTITENALQNFTRTEISNGAHTWQINCTDGLGNKNGSLIRSFDVQVDTLGPSITLEAPANNSNDTNGQLVFDYVVVDQFNGIANCTLIINGTDNQSMFNVSESVTRTFYSNITDGVYNWSVRCFDNSSNFNVNTSLIRRFNVIVDTSPPIINQSFPLNNSQLVSGNITFIYNVTDSISNISNCSIFIDGVLNITNKTVSEGINQVFNVTGIGNGYHNWSVLCVDGSENNNSAMSANLTFLISPDNEGPIVTLINPPNATEDPDGNITLTYNVTDTASNIKNCTLFINHTRNLSTLDVPEGQQQSFDLFNVPDGVYIWQVNCTDTALIENTGNSSIRFFIIGADLTPPTVTLENPANNSNDSDGRIGFNYNVVDFGSNIKNCSVLINNTINQTNTSVAESATQTFTISSFNNGTFSWKVSCTDNSSQQNTANSSFRLLKVINDVEKPTINSILPADGASDSDGNVLFLYNVSDELNGISSCRLYIDNSLQQENTSVTQNTNQSFRVNGLGDGTYQWFVNCTDNSDNQNIGKSAARTLTVQNDVTGPTVTLLNPPEHTLETNGSREFFYNVTDAVSGIASCEIIFSGVIQDTDTSVSKGISQNFSLAGLTDGQKNWSVNCTDNSDNSNEGASSIRNLTVILDSSAPVVNLVSPQNNTQSVVNNVTFIFNVSDANGVSNCSIQINGTLNSTIYNVSRDVNVNFTISNFSNVTINWNIDCYDISEDRFRGISENRTLIIGADALGPTITLLSPPNNIQDPDGNVLFDYNVTDFASNILNCSLIINGTINQTNTSIQESVKQNFTINDMPTGIYTWSVNCTDNSTSLNTGASEIRNLTIGRDTTPPTVTLISPSNNTAYNAEFVVYEYSVSDFASDIKNCTLVINNDLNVTNTTVSEDVSQFLRIVRQEDGHYNWSVNCTDTFNNTGASAYFNISIFAPKQILVNVSTNSFSYEQGNTATISVNTTNGSNYALAANLTVDIIRGNATAPWWNTSYHFRIPYIINASSRARTDKLIEASINFTDVLVNELSLSGLAFDNSSVRVVEFDSNTSIEIPSQFEAGEPFNSINSSYGTLYWVLNSTTAENEVREYYIYFDIIENGQKSAPSYSKPTFSFRGDTKNVLFDNTLTSASHVIINNSNNTFTMLFSDGDGIFNQLYSDYQGAGSILNITMNGNRITNDNSSIVPFAIKDDDYMITNSTVTFESGYVVSFININSTINSVSDSSAQINYTIWFAKNDIYIRAKLYATFGTAESAPIDLYSNLWFAYLIDEGSSSWNSFINTLNSRGYNDTHDYNTVSANLSELNAFRPSDWLSELKSGLGGINLYVQNFSLNNANTTIGIVSFDDAKLPAGTQSDGVGFNLNSDQTIAAGDIYSITAWMRFSSDGASKGEDIELDIETPLVTTRQQGQRFINRTINQSDSNGMFIMNFSTAGISTGFYSAVARAFKDLYLSGVNFKIFEMTTDITKPVVAALSPEGFNSTVNSTFTYNVSEGNSLRNCTLILNNNLNVTNLSPINNAQNAIIVYNIAEGSYNWSVNCTDNAGNTGGSNVKNVTIDYTIPSVILNYPNASQIFQTTTIEFNFTAIDNLDTNLTCNLTIGGVVNRSNLASLNDTITNVTVTNFNEGIYYWNVSCIDDAFNKNISLTRNFTISLGNPKFFPENTQTAINNSNPRRNNVLQISTNATDESGLNLILFSWNSTGIGTWINVSNATLSADKSVNYTVNVTVTAIANTVVGYIFHARDIAGNFNTTALRTYTVVNSPPSSPTILFPSNGSKYNKQPLDINITFTVDADDDAITIYYYINGAFNQTSSTNTTLNASDGTYILNVSLSDGTDFSSNITINFTIDTVKPRINASLNNSSPRRFDVVNMTANVTDEIELSFCQFILNQSANGAKEFFNKTVNGKNDQCSQNFTINLTRGNVINFTVIVNDTADNLNQSQQIITVANSPPSAPAILFPTIGLNTSLQPLSLNVTFAGDSDNDAITIRYYINGTLNQTSLTNTTLNASDGTYILNVSLTDGIESSANTTVNFTIDTINPTTTQVYPPSDYYNDTSDPYSILFNCSATDNIALKNISLYISNRLNQSFSFNVSADLDSNSGYGNWTLSLQSGNYTWNCLAFDRAGNYDWADNRSLLINTSLLDLKIATADITFNSTSPVEDDNITVNATVFNIGSITATNVLVRFFDGDPGNGGNQIDTDKTISSLASLQNKTVNATFRISLGLHQIFVLVDPLSAIVEANESNNNASGNISVPIWHFATGNVTGNLLLRSIGNRTIFSWDITAATTGNLFVVDSDSSITWTNLTALGRNITGQNASNDWEELDRALNTSNSSKYLDSINRTFTSNYVPINTTSFIVFARTIYNVSIANSTNSSNFVTGILWDQSDDTGDGQYNGSEDVAFITEIERNLTGKYGVYDFELRIPSTLKRLKGPELSSVTFYVELR